jgi:hypothetical protein
MNYLEAFLREKAHAQKPHPSTDKTDKAAFVSFVGDSSARSDETVLFVLAEPTTPPQRPDREKHANAWCIDEAVAALRSTLDRVEALTCQTSSRARNSVGYVVAEFGPIIEGLFLKQDIDSLLYCLLDLERNVRDLFARRGYD